MEDGTFHLRIRPQNNPNKSRWADLWRKTFPTRLSLDDNQFWTQTIFFMMKGEEMIASYAFWQAILNANHFLHDERQRNELVISFPGTNFKRKPPRSRWKAKTWSHRLLFDNQFWVQTIVFVIKGIEMYAIYACLQHIVSANHLVHDERQRNASITCFLSFLYLCDSFIFVTVQYRTCSKLLTERMLTTQSSSARAWDR